MDRTSRLNGLLPLGKCLDGVQLLTRSVLRQTDPEIPVGGNHRGLQDAVVYEVIFLVCVYLYEVGTDKSEIKNGNVAKTYYTRNITN